MDAVMRSRFQNVSGMVGSLISVVLVFGGSSALADGLIGLSAPGDATVELAGTFSESDLAGLEKASVDQALTARIAANDATAVVVERQSRARPSLSGDVARSADADLLPYSERLMPLLAVTGREPMGSAVRSSVAGKLRPGAVQPVGVSVLSLRSPTPSERSAR